MWKKHGKREAEIAANSQSPGAVYTRGERCDVGYSFCVLSPVRLVCAAAI